MPYHIFQFLLPMAIKEQLAATKKSRELSLKLLTKQQIYNFISVLSQLITKTKHKLCVFFVVPGNGLALLGMSDRGIRCIHNKLQHKTECHASSLAKSRLLYKMSTTS